MTLRRLALQSDAPLDAAVREAAAAIARGACVVLPTETVYGFAALPQHEAKLRALKGRGDAQPFTRHLASAEVSAMAAAGAAGELAPRARSLADAFWPGPLTLVVPATGGGTVGLRVLDHAFTRAVIAAASPSGLLMTSVNRTGQPPLSTADAIEREFGAVIDLLVAHDRPEPALASTVVRLVGQELEVLREGALPARLVLDVAAEPIVFVCTGNTCRSPLAEVIARRAIEARFKLGTDALLRRGIAVVSAGVAADRGHPASDGSVEVAAEIGLDLSQHRSRPLTPDLVDRARRVFCLTESHLAAIVDFMPASAAKVMLLDPEDEPIPDPIGASIEVYRTTRDRILAAVEARVAEMFGAAGPRAR